ncbi:MAG: nucleoside triphosphate pyrophosphohydrolase family protein [Candidatus Moraniibacteriota bacterium]
MNFEQYQKKSRVTAKYPNADENYIYPTLGLAGEAGEVAEKIKKILRDKEGKVDDVDREEIKKELGDVLWYLTQLATELKIPLEDVATGNLAKLYDRMERGKLSGDGDNR